MLGLPSDGALMDGLALYTQLIAELNPTLGLVGASGDEFIIKHLLDSLAPLSELDRLMDKAAGQGEPTLADLGTGAGLPGIPLALARPQWHVTLVDRMTRRINVLDTAKTALGLDNVNIVEEQVERYRGSHALITFRAFRPFERKLFRKVFGACAPGGFVAAYKGKADKARAELAAIDGLYSAVDIKTVTVPFLPDERCLVELSPAR